jgi:hypothetical protein
LSDYALSHPEAFCFVEVHHHAPYLDEASRQIHVPMMEAFAKTCQRAREAGILRDISVEIITALTMGTLTSLVKTSTQGNFAINQEILEKTENCLWDAISQRMVKEG